MNINNKLLKDAGVYASASIILQLLNFFSGWLLMRYLSVSAFGTFSYIFEVIAIFAFFSDGGLSNYFIKEISQNKEEAVNIYRNVQGGQAIISLVVLLLISIFAFAVNELDIALLLILCGLGAILLSYFSPINSYLIAQEQKKYVFYRDIISGLSKLLFFVVGIYFNLPISYFVLYSVFNFIVLYVYWILVRESSTELRFLFQTYISVFKTLEILKSGMVFTILMIANIIYNKVDVIMLSKMTSDVDVAYYAGATRFVYPFMFLSNAFINSVFPKMASSHKDKNSFIDLQYVAMKYLGCLGILLSTVLYLTDHIIYDTLFNDKFDVSIKIFDVLVWYLAIIFLYGPISASLIAKNKITFVVWVNIIVLGLNVILNIILIPQMQGLGAALATIICELIIFTISVVYGYIKFKLRYPKFIIIALYIITSLVLANAFSPIHFLK
jgi:O-antigen/teichoic acid export membrane protein